jgi:hypothetical protein
MERTEKLYTIGVKYMGKRLILLILFAFITTEFLLPKKLATMPELLKPFMLRVSRDAIYISDDYCVKVFSLKTYKPQEKIGRRGAGPGEYRISPVIQLLPSGLLFITAPGKYVVTKPNGKIVKEQAVHMQLLDLKSVEDNFIARYWTVKDGNLFSEITILDQEFKPLRNLYKIKKPAPTDLDRIISGFKIVDHILETAYYQGKIFLAIGEKGFHYEIYDSKGNLIATVNKPYEKLTISEKDKTYWLEQFKQSRGMQKHWPHFKKLVKDFNDLFPEYYPAMQNLFVADGSVYIKTYKHQNGLEEYVILDLEGNIKKRIFLPTAPANLFSFKDNRFYYLKENEGEEVWELHSVKF